VGKGRSHTDRLWFSDFPARDGDEESVVAGLAAEEGGLEIWEERRGA